tara:strand:+ start:412 stop:1062 length:651 start_codon:yes stop_codon:yes gene_type:complete
MKIAITGISGVVGTVLYEGLKNKYEIIGIDLNNSDININLMNPEGVFNEIDIVIHLAGNKNNTDSFENLLEPNIIMCQRVFEECKKAKVKKVIFASSNHVQIKGFNLDGFGNPVKRLEKYILSTKDEYYPDSFYGVTKIFGEMLGKYYSEVENAFNFIGIRIGWVINPDLAPNTDYFNCMWLKNDDCIKIFEEAINNKNQFDILYGVSGNDIYEKI